MSIILSINGNLDDELRELGHEVISKYIKDAGIYSATDILKSCTKIPDFFIQRENLSVKIIFRDIHDIPCRTVFWSIDTHLNYSWQMFYAKLFDVFLTPHLSFIERLPLEWQHPNRHRMPQNGYERPYIEHAKRQYKINFVGRLIGTRTQRERIAKLLEDDYNTKIIENIAFASMMELYDNTCIIPNESIANEVNFRLLEGASCGACVLCPDVGADQNELFEPGREILIYNSMQELKELLDYCQNNTKFCEDIGYAAWQRVQKDHTKLLRAKQLLAAIQGENNMRIAEHANDTAKFTIEIMHIEKNIQLGKSSRRKPFKVEALRILLEIFTVFAHTDDLDIAITKIDDLFKQSDICILGADCTLEHKKMLCIACGGLALEINDISRSFFYLRMHEKLCNISERIIPFTNPTQAALIWIKALKREHKQCLIGLAQSKGCYRTAVDFTNFCREYDPFGPDWAIAYNMLDHLLHSFPMQERENLARLVE